MTPRILITGGSGQLGGALAPRMQPLGDVLTPASSQLDLSQPESLPAVLDAHQPDLILNCGAYTAVDRAEEERERAHTINGEAPGVLAQWAAEHGAGFIQISTDYVFDGERSSPYTEDVPPSPINAYGASKLAGERAVLAIHPGALVLRVAWLYHHRGANFFRTMLRLAETRDHLTIVSDQRGAPTACDAVASAIIPLAQQALREPLQGGGVYHVPPQGETVWADFARAIFERREAAGLGGPVTVEDILSKDYPTAAKRPGYSVLSGEKIAREHGIRLPHWRDQLDSVWASYLAAEKALDEK